MSDPITPTAMRFVGGLAARPVSLAIAQGAAQPAPRPAVTPSMPVLSSRSGSLFTDASVAGLHWYVPALALAPDPDPAFVFSASQTGQQANGQPFDTATLKLRVIPGEPDDVKAFALANPTARLEAVPLAGLTVSLSSVYDDATGAEQQRIFTGAQESQADGSLLLSFSTSILGDAVPALFQDLKVFGKAALHLSANFEAWATRWVVHPPVGPPRPAPPVIAVGSGRPVMRAVALPIVHPVPAHPAVAPPIRRIATPVVVHPAPVVAPHPPPVLPHPTPVMSGSWVGYASAQPWTQVLPLALKFATAAYEFRFSVSAAGQAQAVLTSVDQLKSFNSRQTQFIELDALGDLSATYPSLARAFVSRLSQQIVLIPQRYAIVRGRTGVSATCLARVDPAPDAAGGSMFEFTFTVAPHVSRLEVQALQLALQKHPEFQDYQLDFPSALSASPSVLSTSFGDPAVFAVGPNPHTFAITLPVRGGGSQGPAVADANLVIQRLCSGTGADLVGTINLSIDPGMDAPISSSLDLDLLKTVGTDELVAVIDAAGPAVGVTNESPLDVTIGACAVLQAGVLTNLAAPVDVKAGASISMAWPAALAAAATSQILADAELKLSVPAPAAEVMKMINFVTVDVSSTQLFLAIDASLVDFGLVSALGVVVAFPSLAEVAPTQFTLTKSAALATAHVQIPLQYAVYSLAASVQVTVTPTDANARPWTFTLQNDFNSEPTVSITAKDIAAAKPG